VPKIGSPHIEQEVFDRLENAKDGEVMYPATLRTIFAIRSAVYKFNKEYNRTFRCTILDDGVRIYERPKESGYEAALKEIKILFKTAVENKMDAEELADKVVDIIRKNLQSADDDPEPEPAEEAIPLRRQARRR
jgi:hypothetical protein